MLLLLSTMITSIMKRLASEDPREWAAALGRIPFHVETSVLVTLSGSRRLTRSGPGTRVHLRVAQFSFQSWSDSLNQGGDLQS